MSNLYSRYRVEIDYENAGRHFWETVSMCAAYNGSQHHELSVKLATLGIQNASDTDSLIFSLTLTASELRELRSMPYWHVGPNYAPHPLLVFPIGSDDNV